MTRPIRSRDESQVLFVAREPDETLRTFLPVIDVLASRDGLRSRVLFHHQPGSWALDELARRSVDVTHTDVPGDLVPERWRRVRGVATMDEIARLWRARAQAHAVLDRYRPDAVVVIQDTLLLERFVVRRANELGRPTLVVQWAFSFPQSMYDRLRTIKQGQKASRGQGGRAKRLVGPISGRAYHTALSALGLKFNLVNSYGGGEAKQFAVMGEAFREQFVRQGVTGKEIVVTGHPTHDAVFRQAQALDLARRLEIRQRHRLAAGKTVVLYATQPVLWRKVMTHETLRRNVEAVASAVHRDPGRQLVLKLHPREDPADYAFCADLDPPVQVIPQAELPELIAVCDLFVSSSSSTILLAMMLDRPIVTVNFDEVPHFDQYVGIGGTLHVRSHAEFAEALEKVLHDESTRSLLAGQRRSVLERYTRFDGHAAERIATLLSEGIRRPGQPAVASAVP